MADSNISVNITDEMRLGYLDCQEFELIVFFLKTFFYLLTVFESFYSFQKIFYLQSIQSRVKSVY